MIGQNQTRSNFQKMPALPNILLGIIVGYFLGFAKVDACWWPYLLQNPATLMSKVSATTRANSVSFYQAQLENPYKFDLFLLSCCVVLIATFVGQLFKYPSKKIYNLGSLLSFISAIVVELVYAAPVASKVAKRQGKIIQLLHSVSFYHAIVLALVLITAMLQISMEQEDEEKEKQE